MITYSLLHSLGACYVGPRASLDVVRHDLVGTRHELEEARRTRPHPRAGERRRMTLHADLCALLQLEASLAAARDAAVAEIRRRMDRRMAVL